MSESERVPYAPHDDFVVAMGFYYNGRHWQPGQKFPWRTIACGEPDLLALWKQGVIERFPEGGSLVPA